MAGLGSGAPGSLRLGLGEGAGFPPSSLATSGGVSLSDTKTSDQELDSADSTLSGATPAVQLVSYDVSGTDFVIPGPSSYHIDAETWMRWETLADTVNQVRIDILVNGLSVANTVFTPTFPIGSGFELHPLTVDVNLIAGDVVQVQVTNQMSGNDDDGFITVNGADPHSSTILIQGAAHPALARYPAKDAAALYGPPL